MKSTILKYLSDGNKPEDLSVIILSFVVALILGMIIYISYKFSHSRAVYSAKFNISLVMLVLVCTMVMKVIGNNLSLSLGMVGALSIVRFRTAIKDSRDTVYIFWCIVCGICCGVSEYVVAFIGSGIIFGFLIIFGCIKTNERFLLIIHGDNSIEEEVEKLMLVFFSGQSKIKVKNTSKTRTEYIYELTQEMIDKSKNNDKTINDGLYAIEGVESVNLVCQNEDISR